jgi:hypothetical protein
VIVDEAHYLAGVECIERAEDRGMAEPFGDAAGVEGVNALRVGVVVNEDGG